MGLALRRITEIGPPLDIWSVVASGALGAVFIYSGIGKALRPLQTAVAVADYQILSQRPAHFLGITLPWLELLLGMLLIIGLAPVAVGFASVAVLLSFTAAVLINLVRRRVMDCHCFGQSHELLGVKTIVRLSSLLLLAALSALRPAPPLLNAGESRFYLILGGFGVAALILMSGHLPAVIRWLTAKAEHGPSLRGGRTSLHHYPIVDSRVGFRSVPPGDSK